MSKEEADLVVLNKDNNVVSVSRDAEIIFYGNNNNGYSLTVLTDPNNVDDEYVRDVMNMGFTSPDIEFSRLSINDRNHQISFNAASIEGIKKFACKLNISPNFNITNIDEFSGVSTTRNPQPDIVNSAVVSATMENADISYSHINGR